MRTEQFQADLSDLAKELERNDLGGSTILVTGATGLIGSIIVKSVFEYNKHSNRPINCVALVRNREKAERVFSAELTEAGTDSRVTLLCQDITAAIPEEISCDYVIHTANPTASKFFITNPVEVIDSIYTGTREVFEYARKMNTKGVVYLSSMEVFGQVFNENRAKEQDLGYIDLQNVRSCYSEGKRLVECMAASYAQEYGLPVRIARLAQTFGAGVPVTDNRVFAQFAKSALRGENIVLHTKGQSIGNYCYTADVVRAILILLKKGVNGEAYTIVNEETTRTIYDMACMVAREFSNGKSEVVFDIPEGNDYGYAPDTKLRLSSAKMNALGWEARYSLMEMYERMIPDLLE